MTRQEALQLVQSRVKNENLIKHMLAVEAIMRALAQKLERKEENFSLAGLLHDADLEETKDRPDLSRVIMAEELSKKEVAKEQKT